MANTGTMTAGKEHCTFCFDVLVAELTGGGGLAARLQPSFENGSCAIFVTWNKSSRTGESRLRGCIGTLEPRMLHSAVRDYALTSALRDRRFAPIERHELPSLSCTVSLLGAFERAAHAEDWEVGTHGLLLEFSDPATGGRRTATFLPEVALHQRWDKQQTLEHLVRKAGYSGPAASVLGGGGGLKLTRYQSTTCSLSYHEYLHLKKEQQQQQQQQAKGEAGSLQAAAAATAPAPQPFQLAGASGGGGGGGKPRRQGSLVTVPA